MPVADQRVVLDGQGHVGTLASHPRDAEWLASRAWLPLRPPSTTCCGHAGQTIATAESLTGGRLAALLTAVPGSSETYVGGVVSYATSLKTDLLGVSPELIAKHGVVSAECARAMATGARQVTGATYAVSTTGVAGPGPQDGVPAGTVYVAVAGPESVTALALELVGRPGHDPGPDV